MRGIDIFASGDMERPRAWLRTVLCPTLVDRQFLESRGFKASFIHRFEKKHSRVLRFDGTVARGVRGINELEFLRGLADVLGVRSFEDLWDPRDTVTTTAVAQKCLDALSAIESRRRQADSSMHAPGAGIQTAATEAGVRS